MAKRSKRRDAWGSIAEIERGKRYVIRYWASKDERGYRRCCETVRGTRADAERRRAELMLEHSKDAPCPTVRQVWGKWCLVDITRQVENGDMAPLTKRVHETSWRLRIEPTWGDVPLDQVRPLQIQQWLYGLNASQAQSAMSTFGKILDYGVRYEFIDHNPLRERYIMPSKSTIKRADKGVFKLQELEGVWRMVYGLWWEPAFILAAFGGCRLGESMAPLASDVEVRDVDGVSVALVSITGQVATSGNDIVPPKTAQSVRTVVLVGKAAERIGGMAQRLDPDCPLTNDGFGHHQCQHRLKQAWRDMKMEHPYRNLRNGWQTYMRWDMKVQPYFIESMMGHKVSGITGAHYDRPDADQFASVMADAYRENPFDRNWVLG